MRYALSSSYVNIKFINLNYNLYNLDTVKINYLEEYNLRHLILLSHIKLNKCFTCSLLQNKLIISGISKNNRFDIWDIFNNKLFDYFSFKMVPNSWEQFLDFRIDKKTKFFILF